MKKLLKRTINISLIIMFILLMTSRVSAGGIISKGSSIFDFIDDTPQEPSLDVDYTVTLDYNDGTGRTDTITTGKYMTITNLPTITRGGYNFAGWWTHETDGKELKNGDSYSYNRNMTIYAHWIGKDYKVILNPNGVELSTTELTVRYDGKYSDLPILSREGYTFIGWFTSKSSNFNSTYYSEKYSDLKAAFGTNETKLRNHWLKNGMKEGRQCSSTNVNNGLKFTETKFVGLGGNGKTKMIQNGTVFDINLYAEWEANKYTITLDANGGNVSSNKITATYDEKYTLPTPTRTDYSFLGWYTQKDGGEQVKGDEVYKRTSNITLYAHWKQEFKDQIYVRVKESGRYKVLDIGTTYIVHDDILAPLQDETKTSSYAKRVIDKSKDGSIACYVVSERFGTYMVFRVDKYPPEEGSWVKLEGTDGAMNTVEVYYPKYIDRYWDGKKIVEETKVATKPRPLSHKMPYDYYYQTTAENPIILGDGTWILDQDRTYNNSLEINGHVNLVLLDGKTLTINKGNIKVSETGSLTIYSEGKDTGKLVVNTTIGCAGIGGCPDMTAGPITIKGGTIISNGGHVSAGIGAAWNANSDFKSITINGGNIQVRGGEKGNLESDKGGNGLGGGNLSTPKGTITINGGTISAIGGKNATGIGRYSKITVRDNIQVKSGPVGGVIKVCSNNNLNDCLLKQGNNYASITTINKTTSGTAFGQGSKIIVVAGAITLIGFIIYSVIKTKEKKEEKEETEKVTTKKETTNNKKNIKK